jgi:hypothetical protein
MAWFRNQYVCAECDESWEDEWSCGCDDDCPRCGARDTGPVDSIDLTEVIEEYEGKFLVFMSPDSAEDSADYELIAECDTRDAAEKIINESEDGPVGFVD